MMQQSNCHKTTDNRVYGSQKCMCIFSYVISCENSFEKKAIIILVTLLLKQIGIEQHFCPKFNTLYISVVLEMFRSNWASHQYRLGPLMYVQYIRAAWLYVHASQLLRWVTEADTAATTHTHTHTPMWGLTGQKSVIQIIFTQMYCDSSHVFIFIKLAT